MSLKPKLDAAIPTILEDTEVKALLTLCHVQLTTTKIKLSAELMAIVYHSALPFFEAQGITFEDMESHSEMPTFYSELFEAAWHDSNLVERMQVANKVRKLST